MFRGILKGCGIVLLGGVSACGFRRVYNDHVFKTRSNPTILFATPAEVIRLFRKYPHKINSVDDPMPFDPSVYHSVPISYEKHMKCEEYDDGALCFDVRASLPDIIAYELYVGLCKEMKNNPELMCEVVGEGVLHPSSHRPFYQTVQFMKNPYIKSRLDAFIIKDSAYCNNYEEWVRRRKEQWIRNKEFEEYFQSLPRIEDKSPYGSSRRRWRRRSYGIEEVE